MRIEKAGGNIDPDRAKFRVDTMKVRLTFIDDLLASSPANDELYREHVGKHAPDPSTIDDEVAALGVNEVVEKGKTIFPRNDAGEPCVYNYQVRGFFKNACKSLKNLPDVYSKDITANKAVVDRYVFVKERYIPIQFDGDITDCQRPLRAQTMQGERVALSNSESVPAGAYIEFTVMTIFPGLMDVVREWLDYGQFNGLGQWRNSGKGTFTWEELESRTCGKPSKKAKKFVIGKKMNDDK